MSDALLSVNRVSKHFGGFTALSDVSVQIARGERFGLIGPNGSGKTTLINCISGSLRNDGGSIVFDGEEISGLAAYQRTRRHRAQLPGAPAVLERTGVRTPGGAAPEYVVHRGSRKADAPRDAGDPAADRARGQAETPSNQLTQVELRKLEGFRPRDGGASAPLISDEAMAGLSSSEVDEILKILFQLNEAGIDHHDRAHHARRDAVLAAGDVSRRRQDHLRGHARPDGGEPRRPAGLSWRLDSQ